jgi:hypothetical protein
LVPGGLAVFVAVVGIVSLIRQKKQAREMNAWRALLVIYFVCYVFVLVTGQFRIAGAMVTFWGIVTIVGAYQSWPFFLKTTLDDPWYMRVSQRLLTVAQFEELLGILWTTRLTYLMGAAVIVCGLLTLRAVWALN